MIMSRIVVVYVTKENRPRVSDIRKGIHDAVHDLVKPKSLIQQVSPDYPYDYDCRKHPVKSSRYAA